MDGKTAVKRLLLWAGLLFSATVIATPTQNADVAALINQRLSHMKDVAGYKAQHYLAIEDLPQEAKVLANSVAEAEKLGLDGESVKPFIQAQMDAAKAIQYRYRADWLSAPEKDWQPAPLEQVRVKISALNSAILTGINQTLSQDGQFTDRAAFMKTLEQVNLKDNDKQRLWQSLKQIRLKNAGMSH